MIYLAFSLDEVKNIAERALIEEGGVWDVIYSNYWGNSGIVGEYGDIHENVPRNSR